MITKTQLITYLNSIGCSHREYTGQRALEFISQKDERLVLPLHNKYCYLHLYFLFQLNADYFTPPFNWKIHFHTMMLQIETNKQISKTK